MRDVRLHVDSETMRGLKISCGLRISGIGVQREYAWEMKGCVWRMGYSKYRLWKGAVNGNDKE